MQIDLLEKRKISRVELVPRLDGYDSPLARTNFEVLLSNDEEFKVDVIKVGSNVDKPFGMYSTWSCNVDQNEEYRYVMVQKTIKDDFNISELRVIRTKD